MPGDTLSAFVHKGVIVGTPRTYGNRKNDDIWRRAIIAGQWEGSEAISTIQSPVHLDFEFRVNPNSRLYNNNVSPNGPDLDTMVIGALGGLLHCRNPDRPTLRLIQDGGLCRLVTASKVVVDSDERSGFTLYVRPVESLHFETPPGDSKLSFFVDRQLLKRDRRRSVKAAAECANKGNFRASRAMRIALGLSFAGGVTRNPLSADWLEAVIDGLGASCVDRQRFFDGPSIQEFGYDDSVVYHLSCAQVQGMPPEAGLHIHCAEIAALEGDELPCRKVLVNASTISTY
jgi:hypothetical protein